MTEARFPKPDFTEGHVQPPAWFPPSEAAWLPWVDVGLLAAALLLGTWFIHGRRRRGPVLALGIGCLLWFGFIRAGCVCPIGGIQNLAQSAADPAVGLPITVLLIVALPLITALFAGRVYCGGVCPFGTLQELVILKPLRLPAWLSAGLGLVPLLYLVSALVMAGTGAGYPICAWDPFVPFFRFDGATHMLLIGAGLLALGTVVARPYCRFLCPYGVLLGWAGRLAKWKVAATPSDCISCHLCADSCPSDVLRPPAALLHDGDARNARRRAGILLVAAPLLLILGGFAGFALGDLLAHQHRRVALDVQIRAEKAGTAAASDASVAFRSGSTTIAELHEEAAALLLLHRSVGGVVGVLLSLIVIGRLLQLGRLRRNIEWQPDSAGCVACMRCAEACPVERARREGKAVETLKL